MSIFVTSPEPQDAQRMVRALQACARPDKQIVEFDWGTDPLAYGNTDTIVVVMPDHWKDEWGLPGAPWRWWKEARRFSIEASGMEWLAFANGLGIVGSYCALQKGVEEWEKKP